MLKKSRSCLQENKPHHGDISGCHGDEYEDDCLLQLIALMMEAVSSPETSVNIYQTTRRNIP
jgi:hypothetical protein